MTSQDVVALNSFLKTGAVVANSSNRPRMDIYMLGPQNTYNTGGSKPQSSYSVYRDCQTCPGRKCIHKSISV